MLDKVKSYYTTNEKYRPVGSNHLTSIRYDEDSLSLFITFYTGAHYVYYGVPKGLYEGLMESPSHGTFFWQNIRQRFPKKLLAGPVNDGMEEAIKNICPELYKLDKLDIEEKKLSKSFKGGLLSEEQYEGLLRVIYSKRDKLCKTLEKLGYFGEPVDDQEFYDIPADAFIKEPKESLWYLFYKSVCSGVGLVFKVVGIALAVFCGLLTALS